MLHLAVFTKGYITKIFRGQKSVDGRFSKVKCAPFGQIKKGDLVLMKQSGGKVVGFFIAGQIDEYDNPNPIKLTKLIKTNWNDLAIDQKFWNLKKSSKYFTFIKIQKPTKFRIPVIIKKRNLAGWIALSGESQKQIELL